MVSWLSRPSPNRVWKQKAPTSSETRSYTPESDTPPTVTDQAASTPPTERSNKSKEKSFVAEEHGTLEDPGWSTRRTIGQRAYRQRRKRGRLRSFFKRKFHQLRTLLGLEMQNSKSENNGSLGPPVLSTAHKPNNMFPEGSGNPQEGCLDSLEQHGHKGHPESSRAVQPDAQGPSTLKAETKGPIDQQGTAQKSMVEQGIQQHVQPTGNDVVTPAAASIQVLGSSGSSISLSGQDSSSSDTSQQPWFERVFYMAIHLNGGRIKQRVTCLDTGADVDVISHQVVEDLGLQPEKYTGNCIYPLGGEYHPEGQVTLSWHVAGFFKTYTTPFLVFNDQYSKDFDVLLGRHTIKKIGFYEKRKGVWFSAAEGDIPVPQPIST